ncbi:efflux RND transporter periplasmic adaptor subunit [Aquifex aeolicus]|uniref:Cation efflux system (CzcB-like) n=1 Tax=Aquifex aeolicus (strain VF5) TaxID=224324 RepID=O67350_AQUAE|nr:efflux RND transporter periplasmic adaptor subunit [Aquifex aeolicus]AAC07317.1 cation efflux system (czcB-like) [Aquifex aeolicus VF5]
MQTLLYILFLLFLFSCSKTEEKKTPQARKIQVSVVEVKREKVVVSVPFKGVLKAVKEAELSSQEPGVLTRLYKREGEYVKKGEVLAQVESNLAKESYRKVLNQLKEVEKQVELQKKIYERRKKLFERELISKEEYEREKYKLEELIQRKKALESELKYFKEKVRRHYVRAPFDGYITERYKNMGDYVTPQTPVFRLINLGELEFSFKVPARYVSLLKKGKELNVELENGKNVKGRVYFISERGDENNQFLVKLLINNEEGKLKAGTFGFAEVPVREVYAFKVPEDAVILQGNKKIIWVLEGNRVRSREVEVIFINGGYAYVEGDLKDGDKVVTENTFLLKEGAEVVVR